MKKVLIAAAAIAVFASAANAGGIVTQMPEVVIVEGTAASSEGIFVPIFTLLLLITLHNRF